MVENITVSHPLTDTTSRVLGLRVIFLLVHKVDTNRILILIQRYTFPSMIGLK